MKILISPKNFFVRAMTYNRASGFTPDAPMTSLLLKHMQVTIDQVSTLAALHPYAVIQMSRGSPELMTAVRMRVLKEGVNTPIWSQIFERWYLETDMIINPNSENIPDLRPFRRAEKLIGKWSCLLEIAFFPGSLMNKLTLKNVINSEGRDEAYQLFLENIRYQTLKTFEFEVLPENPGVAIEATGRFIEPRGQNTTTYDINNL